MKNINLRGQLLKYEDLNTDQQEAILLVHGHPFDHSMWKYQYEALKEFRLILPDLKGYGQSAYDFTEIYIEEQALDLALLLDELMLDKVHLIGLSMGGQIIVEFNRLFPGRVKSQIICASTLKGETKEGYQQRLGIAETISKIGMLEYTKRDIHKYLNLNEVAEGSAIYQHLFSMMTKTESKGVIASHRGRAKRRDNFDYLKQIQVPTLVIAAEKDHFFKIDEVKEVADQVMYSRFKIIEKAGHLPNMEKPGIFNQAIVEFYRELN